MTDEQKPKDILTQMSDALDQALLDQLTNPVPMTDKHGHPVKDENDKIIYKPISAAILAQVRNRLKDQGGAPLDDDDADGEMKKLVDGMTEAERQVPEVRYHEKDATSP